MGAVNSHTWLFQYCWEPLENRKIPEEDALSKRKTAVCVVLWEPGNGLGDR